MDFIVSYQLKKRCMERTRDLRASFSDFENIDACNLSIIFGKHHFRPSLER